jgi:hypothetical protein
VKNRAKKKLKILIEKLKGFFSYLKCIGLSLALNIHFTRLSKKVRLLVYSICILSLKIEGDHHYQELSEFFLYQLIYLKYF